MIAGLALVVNRLAHASFDWRLAASSVKQLHWGWVALFAVPFAGNYYARALRWAVFLRPLKERVSVRNLLSSTVIGFAAVTLFGRPGEFVRPYLIAIKEHVPVPSQLAAWLLERIFDLLMVLLIFGFALMRLSSTGVHVGPRLSWVLVVGGRLVAISCLVILLLLLSFRHFAEPFRRWLTAATRFLPEKHYKKIQHLISTFVQGIESVRSDGAMIQVFVYSVLVWATIAGCYWCMLQSYDGALPLTAWGLLIFLGFSSFGAAVQLPGIGGGIQVVMVVVLTELFHVKLEVATSYAVVSWFITFIVVVSAGVLVALKEGLDWHSLRKLGREAV